MSDYLATFTAGTTSLRDNITAAMAAGALRTAQDGLEVYEDLLFEIVSHSDLLARQLHARSERDNWTGAGDGGEWREIVRDLHELTAVISNSTATRPWVDGIDWIRRMARRAAADGYEPILDVCFSLLENMWRSNLESSAVPDPARLASFLLRVKEVTGYALAPLKNSQNALLSRAQTRLCRSFTSFIKEAYDRNDDASAALAVDYFLHVRPISFKQEFDEVRGASLLCIYAWTLRQYDKGHQSSHAPELRGRLQGGLPTAPSLARVGRRAAGPGEHEIGWGWWEISGLGPAPTVELEMNYYINQSVILLSQDRPLGFPAQLDDDAYGMMSQLRYTAERMLLDSHSKTRSLDSRTNAQIQALVDDLSEQLRDFERSRDRKVAAMPLSESHVQRFRESVASELHTAGLRRLALLVGETPGVGESGDVVTVGVDAHVPKWYFADTYVHAEPESLARDLVTLLLREEEEAVIGAVLSRAPRKTVPLNALRKAASDWSVFKGGLNCVVVTNSWLAIDDLTSTDSALTGASASQVLRTHFGALAYRVFDDREPYVLMFTAPKGVQVYYESAASELQGDEVIDDLQVLIGVRTTQAQPSDVATSSAPSIHSASDNAQDAHMPTINVRVRLLERLRVQVEDPSDTVMFDLPDDAW